MKKFKVLLATIAVFFVVLGTTTFMGNNVKAADPLIAYAWNAYRGGTSVPEGSVKLDIPDGNITLLNADSSLFMSGGDFVDETLYMVSYPSDTSNLYTIDTTTGVHTLVGNTNVGLHGFTYDVTNTTAYGSTPDTLYSIDLTTGSSTLIGQMRTNAMIIGIAADSNGNIFGVDLGDDSLYSINKTTGVATLVGSLGVDINYAQDICFDRDSGKLYGSLYTSTGGLYEINTSTGTATFLTQIDAEIDALAIPYNIQEYTVSASMNKVGAGTVSGTGTYNEGSEVTLTATANPGYLFVNWTEDGTEVSTDSSYTFNLNEDRVVVANFKILVTGITLNKNNVTLKVGGEGFKFIPTLNPADSSNQEVIWSSSNPRVATVSDDGTVNPLAVGSTIITVTTVEGKFVSEAVVTVLAKDSVRLPNTGLLSATIMMSGTIISGGVVAIIGSRKSK